MLYLCTTFLKARFEAAALQTLGKGVVEVGERAVVLLVLFIFRLDVSVVDGFFAV